jgi:hypothetical protein
LGTVGFYFWEAGDVGADDEVEVVFKLVALKKVVDEYELIDLLAVRMPTDSHMLPHIHYDLLPLLLDEVEVLLLADFVLLALQLAFDFFHRVSSQVPKLLVDLLLHRPVVVPHLHFLVFLLLLHYIIRL